VNNPAANGVVIAQSQPQFASVAPGTTITLQVSNGKVLLPDVRGKKDADAKAQLNTAGWVNIDDSRTVDTPDKTKDGTVATENPTQGIAYPLSTQITLVIYRYVKPPPTCTTPPPTPTVSVTPTGTGTPTGPSTGAATTPTAGGLPPCTG
jgi:serine/threonine-protein kinase